MNNILALNGGRGICDFSTDGSALIHYNLFFRNQKGALLTKGRNFHTIRRAEHQIGLPRLLGNVDGSPGFGGQRCRRENDLRPACECRTSPWTRMSSAPRSTPAIPTRRSTTPMVRAILWASRVGLTPSNPTPAAGIEAI